MYYVFLIFNNVHLQGHHQRLAVLGRHEVVVHNHQIHRLYVMQALVMV